MIILQGIKTPHQWQCASDAVRHVIPGQRVTLDYGSPSGNIKLHVSQERGAVKVELVEQKFRKKMVVNDH